MSVKSFFLVRLISGSLCTLVILRTNLLYLQLEFPAVTVCNQNRVHCGLLKSHIDLFTKEHTGTTDELPWMQGLYHLNRCGHSSIGADEIKHHVEKGRFHV